MGDDLDLNIVVERDSDLKAASSHPALGLASPPPEGVSPGDALAAPNWSILPMGVLDIKPGLGPALFRRKRRAMARSRLDARSGYAGHGAGFLRMQIERPLAWRATVLFLLEEARPFFSALERDPNHLCLVGHSYGGGLALRMALECQRGLPVWCATSPRPSICFATEMPRKERPSKRSAALAQRDDRGAAPATTAAPQRTSSTAWSGPGAWLSLRPDLQAR